MNLFAILQYFLFNDVVTTVSTLTVVCALILLTENEKYISGVFSFLAYLLILEFFTGADIFAWVWNNKLLTLAYMIGYFVIGAFYSVAKYYFYANDFSDEVLKHKTKWLELNHKTLDVSVSQPMTGAELQSWQDYFGNHISSKYKNTSAYGISPLMWIAPRNQTERLCIWIGYWPFSAVGLLVARPLQRLVNRMYEALQGIYNNIYSKALGKLNITDFDNPKTKF